MVSKKEIKYQPQHKRTEPKIKTKAGELRSFTLNPYRNSIHSEHVVVNQLMNSTLTPEDLKDISGSLQTSGMDTAVDKLKHAMELVQARTAIQNKYLYELETSEEASCLNGKSISIHVLSY